MADNVYLMKAIRDESADPVQGSPTSLTHSREGLAVAHSLVSAVSKFADYLKADDLRHHWEGPTGVELVVGKNFPLAARLSMLHEVTGYAIVR